MLLNLEAFNRIQLIVWVFTDGGHKTIERCTPQRVIGHLPRKLCFLVHYNFYCSSLHKSVTSMKKSSSDIFLYTVVSVFVCKRFETCVCLYMYVYVNAHIYVRVCLYNTMHIFSEFHRSLSSTSFSDVTYLLTEILLWLTVSLAMIDCLVIFIWLIRKHRNQAWKRIDLLEQNSMNHKGIERCVCGCSHVQGIRKCKTSDILLTGHRSKILLSASDG